ncbi:MAG: bifunctional glycosyltransferase family 2/GtrA family protein [Lachnospiraceae bacterium]|nr:bifunctional glycosyltransferase family 2/GtrA family protein [Lachnospiraceae bacterium]
MRNGTILIPTLNPTKDLVEYIETLIREGFDEILVVDDGSDVECQPLFEQIARLRECTLLRHAINLGKGRALKTGMNYYMNHSRTHCGLITVDSDGQHLVKNVIEMDEKLKEAGEEGGMGVILGYRDFEQENVPPKSRFGNKCTSAVFRLFYGTKIRDTQTGLRAFTNETMKYFLGLEGERFEYETNMLIAIRRYQIPLYELPIDTVYLNNNSGTHFRPVQDSWRIYALLMKEFMKFGMVSILSFLIDITLFWLLSYILRGQEMVLQVVVSTVGARICSSLFNCMMNMKVVFESRENLRMILIKYYALVAVQMLCSALLVYLGTMALPIHRVVIKVCVDSLLFLASYYIQKNYVY